MTEREEQRRSFAYGNTHIGNPRITRTMVDEAAEDLNNMKDYKLAKIAYDAYCQQTGGVSLISGDKLPAFDALKTSIQDAWFAAAEAVAESV
jgi:tRNA/tmRNA/rRNA uracil-C5-methylase (TrmA/RlmC/RlmD family)